MIIDRFSVRVLRSHDYCHFEVTIGGESHDLQLSEVDEARKEAARLADKAVEQYKIAKSCANQQIGQRGEKLDRLKKLAEVITETPEHLRTTEEIAIMKALADESYAQRRYDYQDDWEHGDDGD